MPDLLIELLSEEIPARMQAAAAEDLKRLVTDGLAEAGLSHDDAASFVTPRRLILTVSGLPKVSPATREERKGPSVNAPEKALDGFLRSTGLSKDALEARDGRKGKVWFAVIEREGRPAGEIVAEVLDVVIRSFPWPKSMRWGSGSLRWVRPLHSIICQMSDADRIQVVDLEVDCMRAGNQTVGHRFMAPEPISVMSPADYLAKMNGAKVVVSAKERKDIIMREAARQATERGLEVVEDRGLLAEVAGLVEWPVVLLGEIGEEFLDLPHEVLQTSMRVHQKFFSARDGSGRISHFIAVADRETADEGATIMAGNQKVLRARLSDAKFFWKNDLRVARDGMKAWTDMLGKVTFHNRLGSQAERIDRVSALAGEIASALGTDPDGAISAARIAKADLSSEMVHEFAELQGVMGEHYARAAGHSDEVARVAREHYQPLGPSDDVPKGALSITVALADKIDTLAGFWAIDEKPTGSKDPFALRRAALGVIRLILENDLRLSFLDIARMPSLRAALAAEGHGSEAEGRSKEARILHDKTGGHLGIGDEELTLPRGILEFLHDRMKVFLRGKGIRHDVIDACLAMPGADDLTLLVKRSAALSAFLDTEDGENLTQGFKRAHNILKQAEERDGVEHKLDPDPKLAETDEERSLFDALERAEAAIRPAMKSEDFESAMSAMADLRGPIDGFFDTVQVNAADEGLRRNRLSLLHCISETCLVVADLNRIEG
ncbi:MAG: glycine--tRNA ligase subunit beta [Boseongicola sp. SB0662_bin_57]|nr:glycine--tRNA ligase subunit beta [Boseongicola sp. SB0662_bin_57]